MNDYKTLLTAAIETGGEQALNALGEWFQQRDIGHWDGDKHWNGEGFDCSLPGEPAWTRILYPVYALGYYEYEEIVGYSFQRPDYEAEEATFAAHKAAWEAAKAEEDARWAARSGRRELTLTTVDGETIAVKTSLATTSAMEIVTSDKLPVLRRDGSPADPRFDPPQYHTNFGIIPECFGEILQGATLTLHPDSDWGECLAPRTYTLTAASIAALTAAFSSLEELSRKYEAQQP